MRIFAAAKQTADKRSSIALGQPAHLLLAVGLAGLSANLIGCTGSIEGGQPGKPAPTSMSPWTGTPDPVTGAPTVPNTPDPSAPTPGSPDRAVDACKTVQPGPSFMRRLTRKEYDNTVRELLGSQQNLAQEFPPEELHAGFENNAEIRMVSNALAEKYLAAAEKIGKAVAGQLPSLLPCDPAQKSEDACLDVFLDTFGKRAWRRPLEADEKQRLRERFKANRGGSFAEGIDAVAQIMVLSPAFLYRTERGLSVAGESFQKVAPFEMASRLSYFIWGSMPDAELFKAAEAGGLGTRAEVFAQAKRMLADPRAAEMVAHFGQQWLGFERLDDVVKDPAVYPDYKPELLGLVRRETDELMKDVWSSGAKLETFLTAPHTFVNGPLAAFYGITGVTGDDFKKVALDPKQRVGVLSQGSVMLGNASVDQTSPIKRGLFVQDRMICFEVPQPPNDLNVEPVVLNANMTTRERFATHSKDPSCGGCHKFIDPVGFAFEHFDGIGRWRDKENGKDIDVTGKLEGTDVDGPFDGAVALAQKLATSQTVRQCLATHWFRYAYGREPGQQDTCARDSLSKVFEKSGGDFRELVLAVTQTDAFMFRSQGVSP